MRNKEEDSLQIACMAYLKVQYPDVVAFHVRNEGISGSRAKQQAFGVKSKRMGVLSGVSDIVILEPRGIYHGAMIELKSKKGRLRESQKDFLDNCEDRKYQIRVFNNFDDFQAFIDWYMTLEKNY